MPVLEFLTGEDQDADDLKKQNQMTKPVAQYSILACLEDSMLTNLES